MVALRWGADLGLDRTERMDWVGEGAPSAAWRNASSSSLSVDAPSDRGRSPDDTEGVRRFKMGRLMSGTTSNSVRGLGRLLI